MGRPAPEVIPARSARSAARPPAGTAPWDGHRTRVRSNRMLLGSMVVLCPSPQVLESGVKEGFALLADRREARELLHAAASGCEAAASRLLASLESGGEWGWCCDQVGDTAVILASRIGHLSIVRMLLERRAPPNMRNARGETALHVACDAGHAEVVALLLEFDASPMFGELASNEVPAFVAVRRHTDSIPSTDMPAKAIHRCRRYACLEACTLAMARWHSEAEPGHSLVNSDGLSALHVAAAASDSKACVLLLQCRADVDHPEDAEGATPLMHALRAGASLDTVELLLRHGADPGARDLHGGQPLHYSAGGGAAGALAAMAVARLLRARAALDAVDEKGASPIALAGLKGSPEVVRCLLSAGARPQSCRGLLPLMPEAPSRDQSCRVILEAVM